MAPLQALPVTGARRHRSSKSGGGHGGDDSGDCGWICRGSLTVVAAAMLATLVTFTCINAYMHGLAPPPSAADALPGGARGARGAASTRALAMVPPGGVVTIGGGGGGSGIAAPKAARQPFKHPFPDQAYRIFSIPPHDDSPRCSQSKICDGDHSCGPDGLGCMTDAHQRKMKVREAIRWSWQGYRCAAPARLEGLAPSKTRGPRKQTGVRLVAHMQAAITARNAET
jgi:hypothetical protein